MRLKRRRTQRGGKDAATEKRERERERERDHRFLTKFYVISVTAVRTIIIFFHVLRETARWTNDFPCFQIAILRKKGKRGFFFFFFALMLCWRQAWQQAEGTF